MHAVQINFLPAPQGCAPSEVFERWPSLVDIPEAAVSAGTRVSVIQVAARQESVTRQGIDYHFIDVGGMDVTARGLVFSDVLVQIKADVLHAHGLGFAEDVFALSQYMPKLSIVFQDHADRPPPWWRRKQWRHWYTAAAGIVFTAPELALPFTTIGMFAPRAQLFTVPESSTRFVTGSNAIARTETGLQGNPCVLWVGHLNAGKDPLVVLDGIAKAIPSLPGLQLWCAFGNAPLLAEVQTRIERDPWLAGRVHLLGCVPHARIEQLMQAADLFVSGSHKESCGYALLEALACGAAPVVTDIPSFRILTGEGSIGALWTRGDAVRLAEALVTTAKNPPTRQQVRAHFDAELSFTAVGRCWAGVYAQFIENHARRIR